MPVGELSTGFSGVVRAGAGIFVTGAGPPMAETLACQILFWGHVANRKALASALKIAERGPAGDALLMAQAYRRWGRELPSQVLGEYSLVLYDRQADSAFLAHDSLGLSPLYVSQCRAGPSGPELAFATHLIDLVAGSGDLDQAYIADFLSTGAVTTARTPFAGISRVLPGASLCWEGAEVRELRHWSLAEVEPVRDSSEGYEEGFREHLREAVRGSADGSACVWTDLSGGLDSSSVASIAAAIGLPGLAAWSAYCPGFAQTDERRWMRDVVEMYGLPWHLVNLEQALPFSAPPGRFIGEPTIAVINQAQTRAADELLSANGVEVLLSGHGGDAVLGAFPGPEPTALADPLFEFDLASALTGLRHWRRESTERRSYSYWVKNCLWAPSVRHLRGHGIASAPRLPMQPWLRKDYAARWDLERRRLRRYARPCRTPGRQQLADSLWVAALQRSLDAQRRRSFTTRSPLMARPLVEFMAGIPFDQRMRPRCDRYLQRRALRGILPESVRRRAGKGVGTPVFVEGLSRSPAWIDYLTDGSRLAAHGIADPDRWGSAVRQAAVGQTHGDQFFHAGLALEVWFRQLEAHRRSIAGQFAAPPFPSGGAARPSDSHATCPASRPLPPARS